MPHLEELKLKGTEAYRDDLTLTNWKPVPMRRLSHLFLFGKLSFFVQILRLPEFTTSCSLKLTGLYQHISCFDISILNDFGSALSEIVLHNIGRPYSFAKPRNNCI